MPCRASLVLVVILLLLLARAAGSSAGLPFAHICAGMPASEVLQRWGPPAQIYHEPPTVLPEPTARGLTFRTQSRVLYYYPGTPEIPTRYIRLADGRVVGKRQGQTWAPEPLPPCDTAGGTR